MGGNGALADQEKRKISLSVEDGREEKSQEDKSDWFTSAPNFYFLLFYAMLNVYTGAFVGLVGILVYVPLYGLSVLGLINASLFGAMVYNFTTMWVTTLSDTTVSSLGRRKPFVLIGNVIRIVASVFLIFGFGKGTDSLKGFYIIWVILYNFGSGLTSYPQSSWFLESCKNAEDYRFLSTVILPPISVFGALLATAVISSLSSSLNLFIIVNVVIIGGAASLSVFLLITRVPNNVHQAADKIPPMVPSCRIVARTNEFRKLFWSAVAYGTSYAITGSVAYFLVLLGFYSIIDTNILFQTFTVALVAITAILSVGSTVALNWLLKYYEQTYLYNVFLMIIGTLFVCNFFNTLVGNNVSFYFFFVFTAIVGSLALPLSTLTSLMTRDLVKLDTFMTGLHRENMYLTVFGLPAAVMQQFLSGIFLAVLYLSGYESGIPTTNDDDYLANQNKATIGALWIIRMGVSFIPIVGFIVAYLMFRGYGVTSKVNEQLDKVLNPTSEDSTSAPPTSNVENPVENGLDKDASTDADAENEQMHNFLLHLSVEELKKVSITKEMANYTFYAGSLNATLMLIRRLNKVGLFSGFATSMIVAAAFFTNVFVSTGAFGALLISLLVASVAYTVYELLRYYAIKKLRDYSDEDLKQGCTTVVMTMFEGFHERAKKKFEDAGINLDDSSSGTVDPTRETIVAPLVASVRDLDYANENMVGDGMSALTTTMGYKRIFVSLVLIFSFSAFVLSFSLE